MENSKNNKANFFDEVNEHFNENKSAYFIAGAAIVFISGMLLFSRGKKDIIMPNIPLDIA